MKSYSDTINEQARSMAASGDTILTKHLNINAGSEPKMAPFPTAGGPDDGGVIAALDRESDEQRHERTNLSSVRMTDDESKKVQKTEHRVSLDSILAKIQFTDHIHPPRHPHMTLAIVTMANGFIIIGKSTPADPQNYDAELGKKFATEDAIRQIWALEAYLLREKLTAAGEYGKVG